MLFLMLFCGLFLLISLGCFAVVMRKRLSRQMIMGICIVSFAISALFPMRYILCNPILKDQVTITALRERNDASLALDVIIHYIDSNYSERRIENPVEGKWAWWGGGYVWSEPWEEKGLEPTDSIVFDIPVGDNRAIVFSTGPSCGTAEVSCMGISQKIDLYSAEEVYYPVQLPASKHADFIKDLGLRAAVFSCLEVSIVILVSLLAGFLNRKTNWRRLLKWKYEAFVFVLSWINIVIMGRYPEGYTYSLTYYLMPYERGFGSRGLLGAVTSVLGGPYISQRGIIRYVFVFLTFAYLFFSILIVRLAKKESDWRMGLFWVLLYLLTPLMFLDIFDDTRDLYLVILFLISVILINKNRFVQLIPIICVLMILLNETSSVFFVAPLLALLLYSFVKEKDFGYLFSFVSSAAFTCFTTLWIVFLDKEKLIPIDSCFAHMSLHTDIALDYNAFRAEYRDSSATIRDYAYWMGSQIPYFQHHELLITSILFFILILPFVLLVVMLWKAVYFAILENQVYKRLVPQSGERNTPFWLVKFLYWILLLSSCGGVICMLMAWDYLRFAYFIMIAALAIIFTLIHKENLSLQIDDLYLFTPPKRGFPIPPFAILLYMKFWGTVACFGPDTKLLLNITTIIRDFFKIK